MFAVISPSDALAVLAHEPGAEAELPHIGAMQRSFGAAELVFAKAGITSQATRVFQQGALRARFPNVARGEPPEAVLLNLAGGLTGGDRLDFLLRIQDGAAATVTTQAWEKIYRSPGNDALITGHIRMSAASRLEWLPQPAIFFDGARLKRETHVELAGDASLLAIESVVFGRTARGEIVTGGALTDSWFVHRDGILIHAECFDLSRAIGEMLAKRSVLDGHRALATLRYFAPDAEARLVEMRAALADAEHNDGAMAAASAWNGLMLVRFAAPDGRALNRQVAHVLAGFRGKPLPRVWSF